MPRYRVEVMVSDKKECGNFVFWDRDCIQIIGMSVAELREIMVQTDEGGPKHFPDHLDKMLGLTVALKSKFQAKFSSFSVMRMLNDPTIIAAIAKHISSQQEKDCDEVAKPIRGNARVPDPVASQMKDILQCETKDCDEVAKPVCENAGVANPVASQMEDILQCETQTISGTADHDPNQDAMLTPTKRSSPELSIDDLPSKEAPPELLSATKLSKTIKSE